MRSFYILRKIYEFFSLHFDFSDAIPRNNILSSLVYRVERGKKVNHIIHGGKGSHKKLSEWGASVYGFHF